MSPIKCFELSPQVHKVQALSGSNFFPLTEKASHILLLVSQWKPRAEQEPFAANWFVSSGLALVWSTPVLASVKGCWRGLLVNLHSPTPFAQIGQGYLRRDLCQGILLHLRQPWVNLGKFLFPIEIYKTCADFARTARKSV